MFYIWFDSYIKFLVIMCRHFFEMHVDTDKDNLTINKLTPVEMTELFHEYSHFLQDISTCYSLNGIYVYSEYLHSVVNRIWFIR